MGTKSQLLIAASGILLVFFIYQLPRGVVESNRLQKVEDISQHELEIPENVKIHIKELKELINNQTDNYKKANFVHSLASIYLDYGLIDSALRYGNNLLDGQSLLLAKDIFFKAYERTPDQQLSKQLAQKAQTLIEELLEKNPTDLSLKNELAMTYVTSTHPMKGISMLKEILGKDKENKQAITNLGVLSIKSGQFTKAKKYFEKLVSMDSLNYEAKLYLSVCLIEIAEKYKARQLLEEIIATQDSIPVVKMMANDYLKSI